MMEALAERACERLRSMRMSYMAEALEALAEDPNADLLGFWERGDKAVGAEWQGRHDKKFARLLKQATVRNPDATFDDTIGNPKRMLDAQAIERLATCEWIDQGKNLLITGSTSSGKSYMASCLCIRTLNQCKTVCYKKASTFMGEDGRAREDGRLLDYVGDLAKVDLLVIDDFGLMELDLDKCRDLFEVIDSREGRRSVIVVSQFPVASWFEMFEDATYADACLSRLANKRTTYRLEMNGKSMRDVS